MKTLFTVAKHAKGYFFVQIASHDTYIAGVWTIFELVNNIVYSDLKEEINLKNGHRRSTWFHFKCTVESLELVIAVLADSDHDLSVLEGILKEMEE